MELQEFLKTGSRKKCLTYETSYSVTFEVVTSMRMSVFGVVMPFGLLGSWKVFRRNILPSSSDLRYSP
jgi:hypothetical protein